MQTRELTLLAIDDQPDNLVTVRALLRESFPQATIHLADSGAQGIALAVSEDPDVILLDILMPAMDGFEVCRRLKGTLRTRDTPVVFLTALRDDRVNRVKAIEAGAEAFLSKPIDHTDLVTVTRAMARIKAANRFERDESLRLSALVAERTRLLEESRNAALALNEQLRIEIAARRESEAAVKEREERFVKLFERAPLAYQSLDADGCIIEINQTWLDLLGHRREDVIGRSFGDFLVPEQVDLFRTRFPAFKDRGHTVASFELLTSEGERRRVAITGRIGHSADGSFDKTHCILQDVTERERAARDLEAAEQQKQAILDGIPSNIAFLDKDLVVQSIIVGRVRPRTWHGS